MKSKTLGGWRTIADSELFKDAYYDTDKQSINCTCELMKLNILMRKRNDFTIIDAVCASPAIVEGRLLEDVWNELDCQEFLWYGEDELYYFVNKSNDWESANSKCNSTASRYGLKGHLAMLKSLEAMGNITAHIRKHSNLSDPGAVKYWVGCNDFNKEGAFQWIDNSPVNSTLWNGTNPNNKTCCKGSRDSQDCCQLWYSRETNRIELDDACCHRNKAGVCQVGYVEIPYQTSN
ncbi:echinoidin-like [Ptychodera flava]|uniref:echinoidin-like n=1 Tax=Ptychodera flava TaxID=63121 RepID=UPI003969C29F